MNRIYSTLRPKVDSRSYIDWIQKSDQKLSLSTKGLIAFTSSFCLNQRRPHSKACHVYVADQNTPYQPHLVLESEHSIDILDWDPSGSKLLVCDSSGCLTIFTSKDYLISDWRPYFKQSFQSERFLAASWHHSGLVSSINVVNQNLNNPSNHLDFSEKVKQTNFGASLRLFGGKPAEGCMLVTNTGLVCSFTLIADGSVDVCSNCLGLIRGTISAADICHDNDGSFIIATSDGSIYSTVQLYRLTLNAKNMTLDEVDLPSNPEGRRVALICEHFDSFHLNIISQILGERDRSLAFERVAHVKFVSEDSPDDILIEVSGQSLSLVELWELDRRKQKQPIHSAILEVKGDVKPNLNQLEENVDKRDHDKEWIFKGNYIAEKELTAIQTPKFCLFGKNRQLNIVLLAYKDSTICCMRKEDLQPVCDTLELASNQLPNLRSTNGCASSPYKMIGYPNGGTANQSAKLNSPLKPNNVPSHKGHSEPVYINQIKVSCNQTMFIAIDSLSQLHAIRLPSLMQCRSLKDQETYLQYILEYCLVTGNDWWDVAVCCERDSIDSICDRFQDAYERQPKHLQLKYFNRHLMTRASLYRCLNDESSLCRASDCHTMIMLNSIASTIKSVLRSQELEDPGEYLSNFLKTQGLQPNLFDCNNVISKINEKEFYVELQLIQCLQPLSQWVVDFATFLVTSLPQRYRMKSILPGSGLAKSKEALEIVRELLIIIRIWGIQNEASMPVVYRLTDQLDVFPVLFRLISKIYVSLSSNSAGLNGLPTEEILVEECTQFYNNVSVSQFVFSLEPTGVLSPILFKGVPSGLSNGVPGQQPPETNAQESSGPALWLEYFREPQGVEFVKLTCVEGAIDMNGKRRMDVVRNISLGAHPIANLRHCTRCKSISLARSAEQSVSSLHQTQPALQVTRNWEQRWISSCVCGGSWAQRDTGRLLGAKLGLLHHTASGVGSTSGSAAVAASAFGNHIAHQLAR